MNVSKFKFDLLVVMLNVLLRSEMAASSASHLDKPAGVPINGRDALLGEFPSFISLVSDFNGSRCSGVLINESLVLTAADCLREGVEDVSASLYIRHLSTWEPGSEISRRKVAKACRLKQWDEKERTHNYQVLKLDKPGTEHLKSSLHTSDNLLTLLLALHDLHLTIVSSIRLLKLGIFVYTCLSVLLKSQLSE